MSDGYLEATLIVAGAVDEIEQFTDSADFRAWLGRVQLELVDSEETAEVFTLEHEHSPDIECECAQFSTDHRPFWENDASRAEREQ